MNITVFGDSNTSSIVVPGTGTAWPELYAARTGHTVTNLAQGGQRLYGPPGVPGRTWDPINRFAVPQIAARVAQGASPPGVVILAAGTNDLPHTIPTWDQMIFVNTVLAFRDEMARRWGARTVVLSIFPMRIQGIVSYNTWLDREPGRIAINEALKQILSASGDFIDLDPLLANPDRGRQLLPQWAWSDGLHLSAAGKQAVANALPESL